MDNKFIITCVIIFIVSIVGFLCIKNQDLYSDELPHSTQIKWFDEENYSIVPYLTVIPGYHFVISAFTIHFKQDTIQLIRFTSLILLIGLLIPLFFRLSLDNSIKTLQLYFFPTLFIFFFLIYTDIFSAILVLLSYYYFKQNKYYISGLFVLLSVLVRQNNVVWCGFYILLLILDFKLKNNFENNLKIFKKTIVYIIGILFTGVFMLLNHGGVIGDKGSHPLAIHTANIWFLLFMIPILFLPIFLARLPKIIELLKNWKIWFLCIGIMILGLGTFINDHIYNQNTVFLKNKFLVWGTSNAMNEIAFFIIVIGGLLFLMTYKWNKEQIVFGICTIPYLLMSWMVDVRYYTIFFIFFILWRQQEDKPIFEWYQLIYCILFALIMFWGVLQWKIFW